MKISVAMATYNGETYIEEQLASILQQTVQPDEVIICDDCSRDNTVEVTRNFIREHGLEEKWRIDVNEHNLGYASNFIHAVKKTTGDYILFCDQDDIWVEDRVKVMTDLMESHQEISLLCSEFESFVTGKDATSVPDWEKKQFKRDQSLEHLEFKAHNLFIGYQGCSMCLRRSFWEKAEPFWYEGWAHDESVWRMALCMNGLYVYHGVTLRRRLHTNNVTMHKMRDLQKRIRFMEDLKKGMEATLSFAESISLGENECRLLKRNIYAAQLRIELMRDKKLTRSFTLLFGYRDCYHSKKSILVEPYMALKG